jgi:hypothetical protein
MAGGSSQTLGKAEFHSCSGGTEMITVQFMRHNPMPSNSGPTPIFRLIAAAIAASSVVPLLNEARGQISYSSPGSTYLQDFNSLPSAPENILLQPALQWADDTTSGGSTISLPGWYLYHPIIPAPTGTPPAVEGGANGHQRFRVSPGGVNTGSFYSFGTTASSDRALGDIGSTTIAQNPPGYQDIYIGLRLRNDTGQTLDSFTLSYDGEQWRDGGNATPVAQSMSFMWSTTATAISDTNLLFTTESGLGYSSPVFNTTAAAVDGNNAGRVAVGPVTVTGLTWAPGTDLWLRWDDLQNPGNDHGLAIDNINFSAVTTVPEPTTWALFAIGALTFLGLRRRKN